MNENYSQNGQIFEINTSESFEFLYNGELDGKREIFLEGGRSGGKTHEIAQYFIIQCLQRPGSKRIAFRETQAEVRNLRDVFLEVSENFKNVIEGVGEEEEEAECTRGLSKKIITIKNTEITFFNKSKIILSFINDHVATRRKSLNGVEECWIDEAVFLTEYTHRILRPTIRRGVARLFYTYNPLHKDDYIYNYARAARGSRYIHKILTIADNSFVDVVMVLDFEEDLKTKPLNEVRHLWMGAPIDSVKDCLFSKETITKMMIEPLPFDRARYLRVVVALDPATTSHHNKDTIAKVSSSNESGIIVAGITKEGVVEIIEDLSGRLDPGAIAKTVSAAYHQFWCDCAVVETNQGGDLLKYTILSHDPSLKVEGVWAVSDKINRALPVANLAYMGKIKISDELVNLKRQLERMTFNGYLGVKGESPDRLDAFVWACYNLLSIKDVKTQGTLFNSSMFEARIEGVSVLNNAALIYVLNNEAACLEFGVFDCLGVKKFKFMAASIFEVKDLGAELERLKDGGATLFINNNLNIQIPGATYFNSINSSEIDFLANCVKNNIGDRVNIMECKESSWNGDYGNLLLLSLMKFKEGEGNKDPLAYAFFSIILN